MDANKTYSELGLVWYMVCDVWFVSVGCGCVGGRMRLSVVQLSVGLLTNSFTSCAPHGLSRLAYHNINASGSHRPKHFTGKVTRLSAPA